MVLSDVVNTFGQYLLRKHGERVHKVSIDAGFTCPNRDGSKGIGGCTFCNNSSFSPHGRQPDPITTQIDAGCDVIAQHQDTPGPMQAAEERGKYGISYNSPMMQFAPKAVLTGPVWNWGPYYVKRVKAVMDGTWKTGQYWGPMADGIVDLAPFNKAVPADVVKLVNAKKREIVRGKLHPFAGPVSDNTGKIVVPAGKTLSDQEMLSFNWFVEGVEGTLPRK